jgi:hypothetical protein
VTFGATPGRFTLWFGGAADASYNEGTDRVVFDGNFVPSADAAPGTNIWGCHIPSGAAADKVLRVTTDADLSVRVVVHGYELLV